MRKNNFSFILLRPVTALNFLMQNMKMMLLIFGNDTLNSAGGGEKSTTVFKVT
jgi:hypothetical protein